MQFPREYRLTHRAQFDRVLKARTLRLATACFRIYATTNDGTGARLGIIVGKRQLKRAVDRNRVKRMLRETFRVQRGSLPGVDIVIQLTARPEEPLGLQTTALWPLLASSMGQVNDQRPL